MLRPFAVALLLATVPTATVAQSAPQASTTEAKQAESGKPPLRIRSVTLTGNEPCPQASNPDQEIVVCARVGEPYRIPKALRDQKPIPAQNQSWVNRVAVMSVAAPVACPTPVRRPARAARPAAPSCAPNNMPPKRPMPSVRRARFRKKPLPRSG
jgi:hypothetical protein